MIQKITQNNENFWTVSLIMRAKIVNQSSDFPVRHTGSYRHKKSTEFTDYNNGNGRCPIVPVLLPEP